MAERHRLTQSRRTASPAYSSEAAIKLVLLVNLVILTNILVNLLSLASNLLTLYSMFLHVVIQTCMCFFLEVPRIEELQDPSNSPGREEVGRRTLGDYGGFLPPFFYPDRFRESTSTTRKRQARTIHPDKTPIASGAE